MWQPVADEAIGLAANANLDKLAVVHSDWVVEVFDTKSHERVGVLAKLAGGGGWIDTALLYQAVTLSPDGRWLGLIRGGSTRIAPVAGGTLDGSSCLERSPMLSMGQASAACSNRFLRRLPHDLALVRIQRRLGGVGIFSVRERRPIFGWLDGKPLLGLVLSYGLEVIRHDHRRTVARDERYISDVPLQGHRLADARIPIHIAGPFYSGALRELVPLVREPVIGADPAIRLDEGQKPKRQIGWDGHDSADPLLGLAGQNFDIAFFDVHLAPIHSFNFCGADGRETANSRCRGHRRRKAKQEFSALGRREDSDFA